MKRIGVLTCFLVLLFINNEAQAEKDWWRHATFYQIYPRSFMDLTGNDGIGDLKGIIEKLDHLKDAGMDACWLSPIFASPQVDTGYDVSDFYTIEPDYGNMQDFDNLMAKANQLEIRLMLDFIPNHTSDQHEWFIKSERGDPDFEDYYVWVNGTEVEGGGIKEPNNWVSVFGGPAWTWSENRQKYYLHQFTAQQPDLNYRNSKVVDEMKGVLKYYMDKGVSGFRLDAINHMFENEEFPDEPRNPNNNDPNSYDYLDHIHTKDLQETFDLVYSWREYIDNYVIENNKTYDIILMTEAYASTSDTMRYYGEGFKKGAHMPFNFQLIWGFSSENMKAENIKNNILEWLDNMPDGGVADWVAGSHDHVRVASRVGQAQIHMVNTVVLTLPGASVTYYGEEIGMSDNNFFVPSDSRDPNRTPMQWNGGVGAGFTTINANDTWLPINPNYVTINLEAQKGEGKSTYKYFQSLTALRKTTLMKDGFFNLKVISENVLAFSRTLGDEGYIVVINLDGSEARVDLSVFTTLTNVLSVSTAAPNSLFNVGQSVQKNDVTLGQYDAVVFYFSGATSVVMSLALIASCIIVALLM